MNKKSTPMYALVFRILLILLLMTPLAMQAEPLPHPTNGHNGTAERDSTAEEHARTKIESLEAECDDTALRKDQVPWRAWMGRTIAPGYYVGITAQKAWRPMENFGDRDAKVRVYNPTLGVAVRYSF